MTNFTTRLMVAAATLVAAAGAASAQELKAEIPFAFRTNGATLAPGTYRVSLSRTAGILYLYFSSSETHQSALSPANVPYDAPKDWRETGKAVLSFECGSKTCTLVGVWGGSDQPAYKVPTPKMDKNEPTRVALVALRSEKGD